jgi:hypothetical protein
VPVESGWVFTFDPIHPDKVPPLSSAMSAALDTLSYKELLKNKMALDLYKVIAMKIPLDKDNKQMAITYTLAEEITQTIQSLLPENIKAYSSPFESESISTDQSGRFDQIVDVSNNVYYASAGQSQGLFGSSDIKQGTALLLSSRVDFAYASTHMYSQFANFVNWVLLRKTKKYTFKVKFFGNKLNEKEERELALKEMTTGNSGVFDYFAAKGYEPFQVKSTLILEKALGLRDLMLPLTSMFNSKTGKDKGREESDSVGEAGELSRDMESSENRGDD